jgi:hypothetical protein
MEKYHKKEESDLPKKKSPIEKVKIKARKVLKKGKK